MGFKLAVVLCLSLALVANAQIGTSIANDINAKENQINCLLGKPNCESPPPPPTSGSPPPPSTPPTEGPPPAGVPPTGVPPTGVPPVPAPEPVLAPAPGPAAITGQALAVISLSFPDTFVFTDADRTELVNLIQQELGSDGTVQLQVSGGRKLLQLASITLVITNIKDCAFVALKLNTFIPGRFVTLANQLGIPLQSATLNVYVCSFPGQPDYTTSAPPAMAPSAVPSSGPSPSSGTPTTSPPTSGPAPMMG